LSHLPPVSSIQTARRRRRRYCTFAVTDAAAVRVNVQVLALFPPLEQAPDQMASRPFETVSVIDVPVVKDADPVVPTATLIPAGVEVTLSPLRPVAVTVSVAVWAGAGAGVTVNTAVRVVAPWAPVIVTAVDAATELVVTAKLALVTPAATVTLGGTAATAAFELERFTRSPAPGAAAVSVTVPVEPFPPTTVAGFTDTDDNDAVVTAACGVKRCVAENGPKTPAELLARTRHQRR